MTTVILTCAVGLALGITFGLYAPIVISPAFTVYVAVALLAALDSVLGCLSAYLNKTFSLPIFVSGFFGNAFLAALIIFIGEKLGLDLYIAVVVVFGTRLFQNFAIVRRFALSKYTNKKNN